MGQSSYFLIPTWPAPKCVKALMTLRPFGDLREEATQKRLIESAQLSNHPVYLQQSHQTEIVELKSGTRFTEAPIADASFTVEPNQICAIKTADCLPVLLCNAKANVVAAVHCGWRSLAAGILEKTVQALNVHPTTLMAWLGPCIGPSAFEVGKEVVQAFLEREGKAAETACVPTQSNRWLADLQALAKLQLNRFGVTHLYQDAQCTFTDEKRFFSSRRDKQNSGRMVTIISFGQN